MANASGYDYFKIVAMNADASVRGKDGQANGVVKGIAGLNPLFSVPNSIFVLARGEDIYNVQANSKSDKVFAIITLATAYPGFGALGNAASGVGAGAKTTAIAKEVGVGLQEVNTTVNFMNDMGAFDTYKYGPLQQ
ncbi:hypothetical protein ACQKLP_11575 [Chitinophaga sp. NPDC101104]|uniref:hypothetical protein n=1 Tax=Chitinophaga sp. NPDC101104 TaxID=3390561 RepID=UPI003D051518